MDTELCPNSAPFFGFMGVTSALVFCTLGAAYGTAKSGVGIASMGIMHPDRVMRNSAWVLVGGESHTLTLLKQLTLPLPPPFLF